MTMIKWRIRYSDTDEPDKFGRWARLATINGVAIAWVNRFESDGVVGYDVNCYFPTIKNQDMPNAHFVEGAFEEAKKRVEDEWLTFLKLIGVED